MISISQYLRYASVALAALVVTVLTREFVQFLFVADTEIIYGLSIIIAYTVGIMVNFSLQKRLTFRLAHNRVTTGLFLGFVIVALIGAGATLLVAFALRYGLRLDHIVGAGAPMLAFFLATVFSSFLTYTLNTRYIFSESNNLF